MATLTDSIVSYTRAEIVGSLVLALVVACLVVGTVRRTGWAAVRGPAATLAAAAAFAVLIYIAAPDQVGQFADINARLGLYAVLFLLLWLAAQPIRRRAQWPSCVAALVIALGLTLARLPHPSPIRPLRRRIRAGAAGRASELDPADPARQVRPAPAQAVARSVAAGDRPARGGDEGGGPQPLRGHAGVLPYRFRPQYNLQRRFGPAYHDLRAPSTWAELLKDDRSAGAQAEYVLLWGARQAGPSVREDPGFVTAMRELATGYRLIYVSEPQGAVEVYERR